VERAIEEILWLDLGSVVETVGVIGKVLHGGYGVVLGSTLSGVQCDWMPLDAGVWLEGLAWASCSGQHLVLLNRIDGID
jgi:hypothetical protein